jgi:hypothetical protein
MKLYWKMPQGLRNAYENELNSFKHHEAKGELTTAWRHLERAHILGQPWAVEHTHVHWEMLKFGFRIKSSKEIIGQIPRLLIGGVKSFAGKIPVGNTGGANVPPLQPMDVPEDLKAMLTRYVKL